MAMSLTRTFTASMPTMTLLRWNTRLAQPGHLSLLLLLPGSVSYDCNAAAGYSTSGTLVRAMTNFGATTGSDRTSATTLAAAKDLARSAPLILKWGLVDALLELLAIPFPSFGGRKANKLTTSPRKTILVTGFAPSHLYATSPSNLAVAHLPSMFSTPSGAHLVTLPNVHGSSYPAVRDALGRTCAEHDPSVALHVGLGFPGKFRLDSQRFAQSEQPAVALTGPRPPASKNAPTAPPNVDTAGDPFDLSCMVGALTKATGMDVEVEVEASEDGAGTGEHDCGAGNRHECQARILFLHVPPVGEPYSQDEINEFVVKTVEYLVSEVLANEPSSRR